MVSEPFDVQAKITEDGLSEYKKRIASYVKQPYGVSEVTIDSIRHFAEATGDNNPLYLDEEYANKTKWGGLVAPPYYIDKVIHGVMMGLRGVHAFHSGNDVEWYRPMRVGDTITGTQRLVDIVEKPSKFAGRILIEYFEIRYVNQLDELVAKSLKLVIRAERQTAQERGKYKALEPHRYTEEEIEAICQAYENEQIRGTTPRYWEDVNVGDEIPAVVKGPYTPLDTITYNQGGVRHRVRLKELKRHPGFSFRDPDTGALQSVAQVHTLSTAAHGAAIPAAYDLGAQRNAWMTQPLTHWMGDDGFLKRLRVEYRHFNIYGDTQWLRGKITRKYVKNGEHSVDVDVWAENQRGENTTPGWATVILPSRA